MKDSEHWNAWERGMYLLSAAYRNAQERKEALQAAHNYISINHLTSEDVKITDDGGGINVRKK